MSHVFNLLVIGLLLINLSGISLAGQVLTRLPYGLSRAVMVGGGCAVFFFVEHYIGLGNLSWLLPFSTAGSVYVLWRWRKVMLGNLWGEGFFLLGFGYALAWRYTFPDIDASSEKLADLNFIAGYMSGTRLPPIDPWLWPYHLTQYYSFQHYGASLLGRVMSLPPGAAYNLGYCVLVGLITAPTFEFVRAFNPSRLVQSAVVVSVLMGGTGASLIAPFLVKWKYNTLYTSMRYIGCADADYLDAQGEEMLTPLGAHLREKMYGPGESIRDRFEDKENPILEMPMEIFSYVVQLGDYHAPLGGYMMLATALACFAVLNGLPERRPARWAAGALMATIPFVIATNTWNLPLHGLLVAGCLVFLWRYRKLPPWPELIGATMIGWVLMYPFLTYFLQRNVGGGMKITLLTSQQHAPFISYVIQLWPLWILVILGFFAFPKKQKEFIWFPIFILGLLLFMELTNVDDLYSGRYERFNTTLKWWPWVAFLCMLTLTTFNLSSKEAPSVVRIGTLAAMFGTLGFSIMLGITWHRDYTGRKENHNLSFGQLDGAGWIRRQGINWEEEGKKEQNGGPGTTIMHGIMNYLQANPRGVVLECPGEDRAFTPTGALPLFTGNPTVFGWMSHEQLWRGYQPDIEDRWNRAKELFEGKLKNPLDYLERENVQYILWPGDREVSEELFGQIKEQIGSKYVFVQMTGGDSRKGIFRRRDSPEAGN